MEQRKVACDREPVASGGRSWLGPGVTFMARSQAIRKRRVADWQSGHRDHASARVGGDYRSDSWKQLDVGRYVGGYQVMHVKRPEMPGY